MANGTVYLDSQFKGDDGSIASFGRIFVGQNDTLTMANLGMRQIYGIAFSPWTPPPLTFAGGRRRIWTMHGSIGSYGDPASSYVRVTSTVLKGTGFVAVGYPGTLYIGTATGSLRASFIAWGRT